MITCPFRLRVVVLLGAVAVSASAGAQPPPLPDLDVDAFPAEARRAIEPVYRDVVTNADDAARVGRLAMTLHAWEQWDAAATTYARAIELAPDTFDWPYLAAIVALRTHEYAEAARLLEAALTLRADHLAARLKLAEALFETGREDDSRRVLDDLVREPEAAAPAEYWLGRLAVTAGEPETAIAHFQQAITRFEEFGAAHYALAMASRDLGQHRKARAALALHQRYGTTWPAVEDPLLASVAALRQDARAQAQRGRELARHGDLEAAIAAHEAALVADPDLMQARANLITLYGRTKQWDEAERHYHALVTAGRHLDEAHYNFGVLLGLQQRDAEAAAAYRLALEASPHHVMARNNLGLILERRGELRDALAAYRQAVAADPTFRLARFNLGRMLIALDRNDEATIELAKIRQPEDAETPRYLFALATAHVRAGRREEGIRWARDAQALAERHGQDDLAAAIDRELTRLR